MLDARHALRANLERALELLGGPHALSEKNIHDARKALKRARACLRLLRDAVGREAYAEENRRLRDAARPLAATRDADVLMETISALARRKRYRPHRAALRSLRAALRVERAAAAQRVPLEWIRGSIEHTRAHVARWQVPHDAWPLVRVGLRRIYRRGRRALALAMERTSDATLHETRKQAKYLAVATGLQSADTIAELLGNDHDLALLRQRLPDRALRQLVKRERAGLQGKALDEARMLYRRNPSAFVERLEGAQILQP